MMCLQSGLQKGNDFTGVFVVQASPPEWIAALATFRCRMEVPRVCIGILLMVL